MRKARLRNSSSVVAKRLLIALRPPETTPHPLRRERAPQHLVRCLALGFAHLGRTGTPVLATALMGMAYGWPRVRSTSTAVAAVAHSAYNLVLPLPVVELLKTHNEPSLFTFVGQ